MNRKEAIELLKIIRAGNIMAIKPEALQALAYIAISELELLEKVVEGGITNEEIAQFIEEYGIAQDFEFEDAEEMLREFRNACNAHWTGKINRGEIWDVIVKGLEGRNLAGGKMREKAADIIAERIVELLIKPKPQAHDR